MLLGNVILRDEMASVRADVTVTKNHDGHLSLTTENDNLPINLTAEAALQPFMFPHGRGMHSGKLRSDEYAFMRCVASFSMFTLYIPYVVLQYALLRCCALVSGTFDMILQRDILRFK